MGWTVTDIFGGHLVGKGKIANGKKGQWGSGGSQIGQEQQRGRIRGVIGVRM